MFHRATEADTTERVLRAIFHNDTHFDVHQALPQVAMFGDEGAANHNRLGAIMVSPACSCLFTGARRGPR
jgi:succinylarginine dihydrolase